MALPPAAALRPPVSASIRFQDHRNTLSGQPPEDVFRFIYENNVWGSTESHSGEGSGLAATEVLRSTLPRLFEKYDLRSVLDAPCGDFTWMSHVDLAGIDYIGLDIVTTIVARNRAHFTTPNRRFLVGDLISDELPATNLIICRDCLVHLTFEQIFAVFANMARSGAEYVLATTFLDIGVNQDAMTGDWRPLNLCAAPFNLPQPLEVVVEGCAEADGAYADKSLGLWRVSSLPVRNPLERSHTVTAD